MFGQELRRGGSSRLRERAGDGESRLKKPSPRSRWTKTLADELIDRGITINTVNTGPTDTGWEISRWESQPSTPLGHWDEPDDAVPLVALLCSDDAHWVLGDPS